MHACHGPWPVSGDKLGPGDRFSLVSFSSTARRFRPMSGGGESAPSMKTTGHKFTTTLLVLVMSTVPSETESQLLVQHSRYYKALKNALESFQNAFKELSWHI